MTEKPKKKGTRKKATKVEITVKNKVLTRKERLFNVLSDPTLTTFERLDKCNKIHKEYNNKEFWEKRKAERENGNK